MFMNSLQTHSQSTIPVSLRTNKRREIPPHSSPLHWVHNRWAVKSTASSTHQICRVTVSNEGTATTTPITTSIVHTTASRSSFWSTLFFLLDDSSFIGSRMESQRWRVENPAWLIYFITHFWRWLVSYIIAV